MVTKRLPVSALQNRFNDSQRVDEEDLETEQEFNNKINAATIHNHFGSGRITKFSTPPIIFDSSNLNAAQASILAANNFDGTGLDAHLQPSDPNLGNQLAVTLTDSTVFGRFSVKVLIIGTDFNNNIQLEHFTFRRNETQITRKHFARVLTLFFNDFKGNNNCSRTLGGKIVIREAEAFELSRDAISASQDLMPDLFFRDFKVATPTGPNPTVTLFNAIQTGIGSEFSVDALNITTTPRTRKTIAAGDVTTQIGQKFTSTTDNIQKATLVLGIARDDDVPIANRYDWSGDLIVSIYPLQTTVECPTDIIPKLAIEFEPANTPLAEVSFNQASLKANGVVLTDVVQPVDFVFSNTAIATSTSNAIVPNQLYAITFRRSGAAGTGTVFTEVGTDLTANARHTIFTGVWVDVPEEDMWFQMWSADGKMADGRGYDEGRGIEFDKTALNSATGATIDNQINNLPFSNTGESVLNIGVIQALEEESIVVQDERTGNDIFSRKKFIPSFSFATESALVDLRSVSDPLIVGCAEDNNPKDNPLIEDTQTLPGLAKGDKFIIINPSTDLLSVNLIGSKLIPNTDCATFEYRIFKVLCCTDGYGDVNGDGEIDADDIARATALLGENLSTSATQQRIVDGYVNTLEIIRADVDGDGYVGSNDVDLITQFVNKQINAFPVGDTFKHLEIIVQQSVGRNDGYFDCDGYIRLDGYTGLNIVSPSSLDPAELVYDGYLIDVSIDDTDPVFNVVPFAGVTFQVEPQPFWQDYLVPFGSERREVLTVFTDQTASVPIRDCTSPTRFKCDDSVDVTLTCDPGRNDTYIPGNMILQGQILNPDRTVYPVDLEICTFILELPAVPLTESSIDVFNKLVADAGNGFTTEGIKSCRYASCNTVKPEDLLLNKVRFSVSIQAFVPSIDGYSDLDGYGVIVDDIIGVHFNHAAGVLTLTIKDLEVDPVFLTLVTKIQIQVFLKESGFVNETKVIDSSSIAGLIS